MHYVLTFLITKKWTSKNVVWMSFVFTPSIKRELKTIKLVFFVNWVIMLIERKKDYVIEDSIKQSL